jgi:hypothetical protein
MSKVAVVEKDYFIIGTKYYIKYTLKGSDQSKGLMQIARDHQLKDTQYTEILRLKNGKAEKIPGPLYKIDINDILLVPTAAPNSTPTQVKTFKVRDVAVGPNVGDVWVLDENGRIWTPVINIATGGPMDEWFCEPTGDDTAVALAVDGNRALWKIDLKGRIFYREPKQGLGDIERQWQDESLKDSKGNFVAAVKISAGGNAIAAVDNKNRLWQRWTALRGTSGSEWKLDKYSANVK